MLRRGAFGGVVGGARSRGATSETGIIAMTAEDDRAVAQSLTAPPPRRGRLERTWAALAEAGATVPQAVWLEAEAVAAMDAARGDAVAVAAAVADALAAAPGSGVVALLPSPIDAAAAAPAERRDVAPAAAADALAAILCAWRAPASAAVRRITGASDALAVAVIAETTDPASRESAFEPARRATDGALRDDLDAATLKAALKAERALLAPAECRFERFADPAREPIIRDARPWRAGAAAVAAAATAAAADGAIDRDDALMALPPSALEELLHPSVAPDAARDRIAQGFAASPGAAAGRLAFSAESVERRARSGEPAILVQIETAPEDVLAMQKAVGVLTSRGGLTSHAAVVARGLGVPCVVGAGDARVDDVAGVLIARDGRRFAEGAWATLDGASGALLAGALPTRPAQPSGAYQTLMAWADARRRLAVRANADTPQDVETAIEIGVDGVGLCRTEHMFLEADRVAAMREMILADAEADRRAALARLLPMQRADFRRIFASLGRLAALRPGDVGAPAPVTVRLLDPPLHEFLPQTERGLSALAESMGAPVERVAKRARELAEVNPMLGQRGCRLGVAYPEIYETQARAIFEAALDAAQDGASPRLEIMVPLVSAARELETIAARLDAVAASVRAERGTMVAYGVGIMVETPRAALRAGALAESATFFSFGTNDLTQMTYGLSRDDAGGLMRSYVERGVFEADPFRSLDQEGVGELIRLAVERGRAVRPDLTLGLCGEHGGDPATVRFCEDAGFDYVSCSPFRAPIARLAAAQAAIASDRARAAT